jgi:hypothetical protein
LDITVRKTDLPALKGNKAYIAGGILAGTLGVTSIIVGQTLLASFAYAPGALEAKEETIDQLSLSAAAQPSIFEKLQTKLQQLKILLDLQKALLLVLESNQVKQ